MHKGKWLDLSPHVEVQSPRILCNDLEQVFSAYNRITDGTTSLESEYLEVIPIRH